MELRDDIKRSILRWILEEDNQKYVDELNIDKLYQRFMSKFRYYKSSYLTQFLNELGINPQDHTDIIFKGMYEDLPIEKIEIPERIKSIGMEAFAGCVDVKEIHYDIPALAGIFMADNIFAEVGQRATHVKLYVGENVERIPPYLFSTSGYGANAITDIIFKGNKCTYIGDAAFRGCSDLQNTKLPDSIETIGEDAFGWCDILKSVTFGSGIAEIKDSAFGSCRNLKTILYHGTEEQWDKIKKAPNWITGDDISVYTYDSNFKLQ